MWQGVISVLTAIVGVAFLAVLVAPKAKSAQVISSTLGGFGDAITAAQGPVLGDSFRLRPMTGFGLN